MDPSRGGAAYKLHQEQCQLDREGRPGHNREIFEDVGDDCRTDEPALLGAAGDGVREEEEGEVGAGNERAVHAAHEYEHGRRELLEKFLD